MSTAPPTFAEWTGRTIDERYRIESLLGEGGMGAVVLAHHLRLDKKVALKVILPQFAGDGAIADRFAREAMASAKLEHPHIVTALDYGTLPEGGAYLVLQLVRGPSLREAMEGRGPDFRFAVEVGAQIADALVAAHSGGIVHRDLKPENIVLETRGGETQQVVRVLDFGIARLVGAEASAGAQLTRIGMIVGTPGYMAPEQALGEAVDERADLYALGVILWELSTGQTLFTETEFTALVTRQLTTTPDALATLVDVPETLSALVTSLLSKKDARIASASDVREQLREIGRVSATPRATPAETFARGATMAAISEAVQIAAVPQGQASPTLVPNFTSEPTPRERLSELVAMLTATFVALPNNARYALLATGALALCVMLAMFGSFAFGSTPEPVAVTAPLKIHHVVVPISVPLPNAPQAAPSSPPVSTSETDFTLLSTSSSRTERRDAATRLHDASSPGSLGALVAEFELERDCDDRRVLLESIVALRDDRVVPFLTRVEDSPRRGCGLFRRQDCLSCMRSDLEAALVTFGAAPAP